MLNAILLAMALCDGFTPGAGSKAIDAGVFIPGLHCPAAGPGDGKCQEWAGLRPDIGACESGLLAQVPVVVTQNINLSWVDNSNNEDGFAVLLKKADGTYQEIGRVAPNVITYATSVVGAVGSNWCFAVLAFNKAGNSARSNDGCAAVQPPPEVIPTAPSGTKAVPVALS